MKKIILAVLVLASTAIFATELVSNPNDCPSNTEPQPVFTWSKTLRKFVLKGYACNVEDHKHDKSERD